MKSNLINLGGACMITIAAFMGYWFWYTTVSAKSVVVADLQNQIDAKTETMDRIASARMALTEIAGDETIVQNYFVPEAGVVSFIDKLEAKGKTQGTTISVLSVSTGTAGAQPMLTFTFAIDGAFDAVMRTIGIIEYAPYDLTISELLLTGSDKNRWHAELKFLVGSAKSTLNTP